MPNELSNNRVKRDSLVDLLKGIGMISVVLGHSAIPTPDALFSLIDFVYLYLLMVFFFSFGMVYRPKKEPHIIRYALHQFKGTLPLFFGYCIAYLLLHNLFVHVHILNEPLYTIRDTVSKLPNLFLLRRQETLIGPLWFVPMFLFSKILFHTAYQTAQRFSHKRVSHFLFVAAFSIFGLFIYRAGIQLPYQMHHAFTRIPFFYLGFLFAQRRQPILKFCTPLGCIASMLALIGLLILNAQNKWLAQFPIMLLGLYFCLSLAVLIQRAPRIEHAVVFAGQNSFHIMALHITVSKLIDVIYGSLIHADAQVIARFPCAFSFGWLYTIAGVVIPLVCVTFFRRLFRHT